MLDGGRGLASPSGAAGWGDSEAWKRVRRANCEEQNANCKAFCSKEQRFCEPNAMLESFGAGAMLSC
eukprot:353033-Rhodomonas_salina.2